MAQQSLLPSDRFKGCLIGLAAGDALGTTVEFLSPGTFLPVKDMVGGGPFELKPGEWTDDTSMALCLAQSLIEKKDFDPVDQLAKYLRWYRRGYMSCKNYCFDIGNTVRKALLFFEQKPQPYCGSTDPHTAGNGCLMRLAPVPMFYHRQPRLAIEKSGESSLTTHGARACVDASRYFGGLLTGALLGHDKEQLLSERYAPVPDYWMASSLISVVDEVACGSFKYKQPPEIVGSGYVVKSLEAALWAFYSTSSFEEGCLKAVNLGNDADTTAAIYGQLAGAYYGLSGIPERWVKKLVMADVIFQMIDELETLALR